MLLKDLRFVYYSYLGAYDPLDNPLLLYNITTFRV